jgi:hypothetical protein
MHAPQTLHHFHCVSASLPFFCLRVLLLLLLAGSTETFEPDRPAKKLPQQGQQKGTQNE